MTSWLSWRRFVPYLAVPVLGCWIGSVRTRWCETEHLRTARGDGQGVIYAFWHESLLHFTWSHRRRGIGVMISRHGDGELIARAVELLGFTPARGSTTRGGAAALRKLSRRAQSTDGPSPDFAITPDGPRGPRRTVQAGIIELAARTGLPIVPAALHYARCWRAGSWDRLALPRPFTRAVVLFGEPLRVERDDVASADARDQRRALLEHRLRELSERSEREFGLLYRAGAPRLGAFDPRPIAGSRQDVADEQVDRPADQPEE
ncbi:MAG: lysophospholipid acyltransferase family protein [Planctomycetota bacterium]